MAIDFFSIKIKEFIFDAHPSNNGNAASNCELGTIDDDLLCLSVWNRRLHINAMIMGL